MRRSSLILAIAIPLAAGALCGLTEQARAQDKRKPNPGQPACMEAFCAPHFYVDAIGGYGFARTDFRVDPSFSVDGSGGFVEIGGGFIIPVNSRIAVGARLSGLLPFGVKGDTFYSPTAHTYTVEQKAIAFAEFTFSVAFSSFDRDPGHVDTVNTDGLFGPGIPIDFQLFFGAANGARTVVANPAGNPIFPGGPLSDTANNVGFTAGARYTHALTQQIYGTAQFRWVHFPETTVRIPGVVPIQSDQFYAGVGVTLPFTLPVSPR